MLILTIATLIMRGREMNGPLPAVTAAVPLAPLKLNSDQLTQVKDLAVPLDEMMDAEVMAIKQLLPIRTDDYMSVVDVKYGKQTLFFIQKRNEWMGPRRFTLGLRYSHEQTLRDVCANPYLVRFLKRGVAIQYNFLNHDGSRMAEEIFLPEECSARGTASL